MLCVVSRCELEERRLNLAVKDLKDLEKLKGARNNEREGIEGLWPSQEEGERLMGRGTKEGTVALHNYRKMPGSNRSECRCQGDSYSPQVLTVLEAFTGKRGRETSPMGRMAWEAQKGRRFVKWEL